MNSLLTNEVAQWVASNAVLAGILALLLAAAQRWIRSAALRNVLWWLVLVKLITPPLWEIPITLPQTSVPDAGISAATIGFESAVALASEFSKPSSQQLLEETSARTESAGRTPAMVLGISLLGTLVLWAVTLFRSLRFAKLVRRAPLASEELQSQVDALSKRLGIRQAPRAVLVEGRIPPLLWSGWNRPLIVLPAPFFSNLAETERQMLIGHELAHLRRCDHWLRWIETFVVGLYWWHPAVWWTRRELRRAEEECCDAWVLSVFSGEAKAYAGVLLKAVDFLSEETPVPATACGFGQTSNVKQIKRRFQMILKQDSSHRLSWRQTLLAAVVAAAILPLASQLARTEAAEKDAAGSFRPGGNAPATTAEPASVEARLERLEMMMEKISGHLAAGTAVSFAETTGQPDRIRRRLAMAKSSREIEIARAESALELALEELKAKGQLHGTGKLSDLEVREAEYKRRLAELRLREVKLQAEAEISELQAELKQAEDQLASRREPPAAARMITVIVKSQSPFFFIDGKPIDFGVLKQRLASEAKEHPESLLGVFTEKNVPTRELVRLLDAAREAGIANASIAGESRSSESRPGR